MVGEANLPQKKPCRKLDHHISIQGPIKVIIYVVYLRICYNFVSTFTNWNVILGYL